MHDLYRMSFLKIFTILTKDFINFYFTGIIDSNEKNVKVGEYMKSGEKDYSVKEAMIFSQRIAQLSKALWKCVEKDWQMWIKPYDLNINEHHILTIAYHLKGASISEIAKFGVMHVSTAFNFSKKLEERGYLVFSKKKMINEIRTSKLQTKGKNYYFA